MMPSDLVKRAALNNATWCDAMARTHGTVGVFSPACWFNRHAMPRFYPNLVTLDPAAQPSVLIDRVRDLINAGLPNSWAVKDSFCRLDLERRRFEILLEALWLHRPVSLPRPIMRRRDVVWRRVATSGDLVEWERAWSGAAPTNDPAIFRPPLLAERNHHFIAGYQDGRIVAGCIASEAADMIGITNLFLPHQDRQAYRGDCIAAVIGLNPSLPLVSYDGEEESRAMQDVGFERIGSLRVFSYRGY